MAGDTVDTLLEQWRRERPELDVSGLALVVRIELLAKLLRRGTATSLADVGLKTWEYDVLSALRRQGAPFELPATELARATQLTSGAMTTRIDHLEERGLVARRPDPEDRRGVRVTLTREGVALIDRAIHTRLMAAETSVKALDVAERAVLERGLRKLLIDLAGKA